MKQTERRSGSRRRKIGWIFCSPKGINKLVDNLNCAELKAQEDLRINEGCWLRDRETERKREAVRHEGESKRKKRGIKCYF